MNPRLGSAALLALALALATAHPFGAVPACAAVLLFACMAWFAPGALLPALLALLPVASAAPHTGWVFLHEWDLLVLAGCAGVYWRVAGANEGMAGAYGRAEGAGAEPATDARVQAGAGQGLRSAAGGALTTWALLAVVASQALAVAVAYQAQPWAWADVRPWGSYRSPGVHLMGLKGALLLAVLAPWVARVWVRDAQALAQQCSRGMALGLLLCSAVVVQERVRFTGLWNLDMPYRATGPFWEMHIGGAALDGYLAISAPFALYLLLRERVKLWWCVAAVALLMGAYAAVASNSRIPYAAMAASLLVILLGWGALRGGAKGQADDAAGGPARSRVPVAGLLVAAACAALIGWAVQHSSFLQHRFSMVDKDLQVRRQHWQEVVGLLQTPAQQWLGLGAGRYIRQWQDQAGPAEAAAANPAVVKAQATIDPPEQKPEQKREHKPEPPRPRLKPGDHALVDAHLELRRAQNARHSGELYRLLQWVAPAGPVPEQLWFSGLYRTPGGPLRLEVKLCARHLLYTQNCRWVIASIDSSPAEDWRPLRLELRALPQVQALALAQGQGQGQRNSADGPWALSLAVRNGADVVHLSQLSLRDAWGREWLRNGDFSQGLGRWFFSSDAGHLQWNAQNMALHVWVEQGWVGLAVWAALLAVAVAAGWRRGSGQGHGQELNPFRITVLAALAGALVVGAMDALVNHGRLWFLFHGLLALGVALSVDLAQRGRRQDQELTA